MEAQLEGQEEVMMMVMMITNIYGGLGALMSHALEGTSSHLIQSHSNFRRQRLGLSYYRDEGTKA